MSIIVNNSTVAKFAAGVIGLAMVLGLAGLAPSAHAQTVAELTAQINSLLATIASLQAQLSSMTGGSGSGSTASVCPYTWAQNLTNGSTGPDVLALQRFLNSNPATQVAASGIGSAGNESDYFGSLTKAAVAAFQNLYKAQVLTPVGLTSGTGYFGPSTRAHMNSLCTSAAPPADTSDTTGDTTGDTTVPGGSGVAVSGGVQPSNSLAPQGSARVPFTTFTVTASADGPVTINGVVVERIGLGQDSAFAGIVLLDSNGTQIGIAKTLNSNHQATVGDSVTVPAGQSRTFTIAGNMAASLANNAGEVIALSVVGLNTSATVSGSLPITGASHTMNATLSIGSITAARGVDDPNVTAQKEVGTTDFIFSSIKLTAGSAEKVRLNSIRWNQSGSAAAGDLENVTVYVDGVAYTPTLSADGKYYTVVFGNGISIAKGLSKEISIRGDIVSGSGRTIAFDIYKMTDINVTGETYGYGITPTAGTGFVATSPVFDAGGVVTVSNGSISVAKATDVPAQNIAVNVANQTLGGFEVEVRGEEISVASMVFTVATTSTGPGYLTNVTLVDANGAVVAGPVDTSGLGTSISFGDTVTFPIGKGSYTLKGQTPSTWTNNGTVVISTNPATQWTTVTGQVTGNSLTPTPNGTVSANTMTVKSGSVTISTANTPAAQSVVAGAQGFTFANFQLDASASGEDVRFTTLKLELFASANPEYMTGCQLFDGATAIMTGSNKKDILSTHTNGDDVSATLDSGGVTVPKGTIKTLAWKCNLSSSATNQTYLWAMSTGTSVTGVGLDSGQTITASVNGTGQTMTATSQGSFTVELDPSSPSYALAAAGSSNVTLAVLKLHATNEAMNLKKIALQLTNTASSSASDLTQVTLWDGTTQVGSVIFTGSNTHATATLSSDFVIPKDGDKILTIKGNLAAVGSSQVGTQGALIAVDYDGDNAADTEAIGQASGSTQDTTSTTDTAASGVRMFKSFPTLAKIAVPTNILANGEQTLARFSITADSAGAIGLAKLSLNITETGATVASVNVFGFTDSGFSTPVSGVSSNGALMQNPVSTSTDMSIYVQTSVGGTTTLQIPAGTTRYFEVRGTVSGVGSGDSVSTQLLGDAAYSATGAVENVGTLDSDTNNDFIWSGNATTTSSVTHKDWTNGFGLTGLPSSGMTAEVLSK